MLTVRLAVFESRLKTTIGYLGRPRNRDRVEYWDLRKRVKKIAYEDV